MRAFSRWFHRTTLFGIAAGSLLIPATLASAQEPTPDVPKLPPPRLAAPVTTEAPKVIVAPPAIPDCPKSAWYVNPPYRSTPRVGFFPIPPTGCGYYSVADMLTGESGDKAPKSGYPPFALNNTPFYEADFRYVDDPKYDPDFLERLHRIHIGDNWLLGTGGEARWRHMHEFSSRFTGKTNDYDLTRIRLYGDVWYKDTFRIYAEVISANTASQDLAPLRIDENKADFQNLFIDVKVGEIDGKPVYVRVGRQELLMGSQRLISPPDWANTRRTFQGVRGFWSNDKVDIDLFWVKPVIPNNSGWSPADHNQNFYGAWLTYHPQKKEAIDLYYLYLDNYNKTTTLGLTLAPTGVHTLGTRYSGSNESNGFLWDVEGMLQLGQRDGQSITAGSASAGLGYNAKNLPMNPTAWIYYDWASGDGSPNAGDYNTFNQLFPLGHHYFGWLDLVGRQNIRDWNAHLYLYPAKWLTLNAQYHVFSLDSARDALYNAGGAPIRASLGGAAGGRVGQEFDLIANFHLSKRSDFMVGWSKLQTGDFISNTGNGRSPELFYMMYNVRW
ncbi:MAG: alginate export family protein [Planctomycetes bacterium]|nr:alginate export family protein [Planctomycetota bacterium]